MVSYQDIEGLKKRFLQASSSGGFAEFHDHYFDNYIETDALMRLGHSVSAPRQQFLNRLLAEAYAASRRLASVLVSSCMMEIRELAIIHGGLTVNGKAGSLLYFTDLGMGMLAVVENLRDGEMTYMRFTATVTPNERPH